MNDKYDYLVEEIQKIIEKQGDSYKKALFIVKEILVPAVEETKDSYERLMLYRPRSPPN